MPKKRNSLVSRKLRSLQRASRHVAKPDPNRNVVVANTDPNPNRIVVVVSNEADSSVNLQQSKIKLTTSPLRPSDDKDAEEFCLEIDGREFQF